MTTLSSMTLSDFLSTLSSKSPVPGGGTVAGTTGATAAALAHMVVAYSVGRKSLAGHKPALEAASDQLEVDRDAFLALADEDAQAYQALNAMWKLPEDAPERVGYQEAVTAAISAPKRIAQRAHAMLQLCESLVAVTNPMLRSDLAIAAVLAEATVTSGIWNVRINLPELADENERAALARLADDLLTHAATLRRAIEDACA